MKNLFHHSLFVISCLLFVQAIHAQVPSFSWNVHWGTTDFDTAPRLATDHDGNVYSAGTFKGTVDFDPGTGDATLTSGFNGFGNDTYISKFDSSGTFQWVKRVGGVSGARAMLYDSTGYIVIVGDYAEATDFDPGPGVHNLTPVDNSDDTYVLKLDLDGNFVFAVTVGGAGNEYPGCVSMDTEGSIVLGGLFSGTSDFDPGPGQTIFTAGFLADIFMVKLNANGNFIWAKEFSGDVQGDLNGMAQDEDGNIYVTGIFDDRRDFDPGPDSLIVTATGYWDVFVVKLNSEGELLWLHHLGNAGDNWAHDLIIDHDRNIYVTGYFSDTLDFDPGPETLNFMATNTDPYIWKLDTDGNLVWAVQYEGESFDQSKSVTMDRQGNIYSTGWFGETQDFDPGPGHFLLTSAGGNDRDDAYITKLNHEGKFIWAYALGGLEDDYGMEAKVDDFGNIFISGTYQGKAGFYPGGLEQDSLVSNGMSDIFLARWTQCIETYFQFSTFTCDTYTSPSGKYTWDVSGDYMDTLTNAAGCDSILTIHLMASQLDDEVILTNTTLESQQPTGPYQWLDCDNGYAEIPGATSQSFTPQHSGNYAVGLFDGICFDTSLCINVMIVDVQENHDVSGIHIFPNPTGGDWVIDFGELNSDATVDIFDESCRLVYTATFRDVHRIPMHLSLSSGLYVVRVMTAYHHRVAKLVVY